MVYFSHQKDPVSNKIYGSMKMEHEYTGFAQKLWRQQNNENVGTNWHIFSKALLVPCACTKLHVLAYS